jgi:hypothetical protein
MHRVAEATLGDPDISQGDYAPDGVSDVPGPLQMRDGIGTGLVCRLEIPARPTGESQQASRGSAPKVVVLGCEVQRLTGVAHGVGHIRQSQGACGTVHGDRARQTVKCLLVHDDHLGGGAARWPSLISRIRGRSEPAFGVPHSGLDAFELTAGQ